ncbi:MAG: ammonia-dependent NAD(+) synthetase [Castellaniella sp.]
MSAGLTPEQRAEQARIIQALGVLPAIDAQAEVERRSAFLADYLRVSGLRTLVVGMSGGVDSLLAGLLVRKAMQRLRAETAGSAAASIGISLPYGEQRDVADARACLALMQPDQTLVVNIRPAVDALMAGLETAGLATGAPAQRDFVLGNIKARQRMVALFAVAGAQAGLVVGTDQAAETLVGFSTKFGDNAADIMPLEGLNKRQVRTLARHLGAPDALVDKVPTADLESLSPQRPDEDAFGVSYDEIDDFLEGKPVSRKAGARILHLWRVSAHKRALPPGPVFSAVRR